MDLLMESYLEVYESKTSDLFEPIGELKCNGTACGKPKDAMNIR